MYHHIQLACYPTLPLHLLHLSCVDPTSPTAVDLLPQAWHHSLSPQLAASAAPGCSDSLWENESSWKSLQPWAWHHHTLRSVSLSNLSLSSSSGQSSFLEENSVFDSLTEPLYYMHKYTYSLLSFLYFFKGFYLCFMSMSVYLNVCM